MPATTTTPTNRNFLSPLNFRMVLQRTPTVNFFLQGFALPGLSYVGNLYTPTPFVDMPIPGDHLNYAPLTVSFMVDEDLTNYLEVFNWIKNNAGPTSLTPPNPGQVLSASQAISTDYTQNQRSDIKILVLSSAKKPNIEVSFYNAFPVSLGELQFSTTSQDVTYLEASVTFNYITYSIASV
jgi:hypothetical protein